MPHKDLHRLLKDLDAQLEHASPLKTEDRELLQNIMDDIQRLLNSAPSPSDDPARSEGVVENLTDLVGRLESSHPALTAVIGRMAETLSAMGI